MGIGKVSASAVGKTTAGCNIFSGLLFIPKRPRNYVVTNQSEAALRVLKRLHGEESANQKIKEVKKSVSKYDTKPRLSDLLDTATQKIKPIVWVGLGLATFQQLVGINVVFYYGAVLWQAVGFSESDSLLINIVSRGSKYRSGYDGNCTHRQGWPSNRYCGVVLWGCPFH